MKTKRQTIGKKKVSSKKKTSQPMGRKSGHKQKERQLIGRKRIRQSKET
jgi:hypothetical protein